MSAKVKWLIGGGALGLVIWGILPKTSWIIGTHGPTGVSLNASEAHGICNSSLGVFGQALSPQVAHSCADVNNAYTFFTVAGWAGLICLIVASYYLQRDLRAKNDNA